MSERKRRFWFKDISLAFLQRAKPRDHSPTANHHNSISLDDICDESGMFVESKLDLNEILSPKKLSSPSCPRILSFNQLESSHSSSQLSLDKKLESAAQKQSASFSESNNSVFTGSPPTPIGEYFKTVRKNKSLGDLSRHFRRSPKSIFSEEVCSPTKRSEFAEFSDQEPLSTPISLGDLRLKHGLPAVSQLSRSNKNQSHPHHPFEWNSRNLWCMNCTTMDIGLSWANRVIPQIPKEKTVGEEASKEETSNPTKCSLTHLKIPDARRELPLRCSICRETCCIYGGKKLALVKTDKRNIDISSLSTKQRGLMMRSYREAMKDLYEIEASCIGGRDPRTFIQCMEDNCQKIVCPSCAARCAQSLCGLIFCRLCWPEQTGRCKIHCSVEDITRAEPQQPKRPPPPLPSSRQRSVTS